MSIVAISDAACRLDELVAESRNGEEIILTKDDRPVAKIVPLPMERPRPRRGSGKDFIAYIAPDFGATPEGFEEYMPWDSRQRVAMPRPKDTRPRLPLFEFSRV